MTMNAITKINSTKEGNGFFIKTIIILSVFMISVSTISATGMLRLKMNGLVNSLDETVVYYQEGATSDFDPDFDSYKLFGPNPAPHISQEYNSTLMAINGIDPSAETFSINIRATTHTSGNFTITATDFSAMPKGSCVYLKDLLTGTTVNILISPYAFSLSNATTSSRFVLIITQLKLSVISDLTQPGCQKLDGGKVKIAVKDNGPWNYIWKDSLGAVIKTSLNSNHEDSLDNLTGGNYSVEIFSLNNSCYYKEASFSISAMVAPIVSFSSPDVVTASIVENYSPVNQSLNCTHYTWNFGDGTGISSEFEPSHKYALQGLYQAKLVATSSTGCKDSVAKLVKVMDLATSVMVELKDQVKLIDRGNNIYAITIGTASIDALNVDVIDMTGKNLMNEHIDNVKETGNIQFDLNHLSTGIYVVNITHKDKTFICTKVLVK